MPVPDATLERTERTIVCLIVYERYPLEGALSKGHMLLCKVRWILFTTAKVFFMSRKSNAENRQFRNRGSTGYILAVLGTS